ncbi:MULTISPECIES: ABC transporter ATP-binding protein [Oenococcus]|uniref:BrcA-like bacitracin transport ATP-binding protein n=1 Tax=Oenococcus kitaharae DSM 17330 TaxID=1045004 RepID=G9WIX3_9LACO|nr:ABC transporter ATP-binding protein [Oenococcus kitaharae]EHN58422.1 BrcA-like bacitracin transport ATP-binding protein [Oenococcus kitaharae DSM 17330]MCV3296339.1 ABC transporter ATP-binding protein [Oenococcus kitaharae]OEY81417.1 multidrug ABC transporter ATP-binding protein [Oenococcus kitaharae]OEY82905.1 multidrug ABC transporter ATP-binding protein [Oenococcus kitaharae]OEY84551.1 multidrug ABC transporter ATP-binding protein [Oenococcus kitaharae]
MIEVKNIIKTINHKTVLDNLSLTFETGKIYGLKGRNGAGKTMLLRAIAGLIRLDSGSITIDGKVLHRDIDFPSELGLLIENNNVLPEFTLRKNLLLLAKIRKVASPEMIDATIKRVGLDPTDKRKVRQYSLGMKQRAAIAQALFEKPKLILLDEPTNAIDIEGVKEMRRIFEAEKEAGATIILASHNPEDLSILADQVFNMEEGKLV